MFASSGGYGGGYGNMGGGGGGGYGNMGMGGNQMGGNPNYTAF